jgi:spore photoproduct lyase
MKTVIKEHFPEIPLFNQEFLRCPDGKYRYFYKHRAEMYSVMQKTIRGFAPEVPVYLCMEASYMWRMVFGYLPEESILLEPIYGPRNTP